MIKDAVDFFSVHSREEVKEVNIDAEWKKYFEHRGNMATVNIKHLAKHFYELGLAQKGE